MAAEFEPDDDEVARIWLDGDVLHYSVRAELFEEPATWGEVLADMAAYAAESLAAGDEAARLKLLDEMKAAFLKTMEARAKGEGG
jgi:hypothetical protein